MSAWADVGGIADLEARLHLEADVDGFRVRVTRINGTLYAFEDRCTHDDSPFDDAIIEDCEITCPRHGARFSLRSGEALSPPAYEPLRIFEVRAAGERIEVRV